MRQNHTEEFLAEDFGVWQPTISRTPKNDRNSTATRLSPSRTLSGRGFVQHHRDCDRGWRPGPTYNWRTPQDCTYTAVNTTVGGFNHQILCTLEGTPLVITDPVAGVHHDAFAYRWHALGQPLDPHKVIADKGCQRLDLIAPAKNPPGGELADDEKYLNRLINHYQVVVEHVIAHFKCWRALSAIFRRPLASYRKVFSVVRALFFW